ncbi:Glyoxylase, beta-lactamase superfamily II [Actinokineospora alba]|uniref:Glyoxylase, beta-lactamase superfamily II n=1 Tax=Actinokineospora alba TaxID=504798 RepID=A0A1H0WA42_9PSEU|nr:MBL fold metallo-hydrolase [Actinokineospora alba]TDP66177.1 glyoxylase-like metal-dependent hydrolase (beta-lactamase superfamily II) [Actinokineospora alba]SDJ42201.1 Glyoxylase, beta-lactamase superfamily II [Actinokineospora alba]SDP87649.1 Glyoxylase, beta-lactamase superfamily II [Actinokineospora alba]
MSARIDYVVTSGTFNHDGETHEVDNNVWIIGDDDEVVIIDAAHDADEILAAVDDRRVKAIICTHAHDDHINVAEDLAKVTDALVMLHPADEELWRHLYPDDDFESLFDGEVIEVAGIELHIIHTPGHTPGGISIYAPELDAVFTGDTLFRGGPGATGRSLSDFPTIIDSITERLFELPSETIVHTGHGDSTSIGQEAPDLDEWLQRGH